MPRIGQITLVSDTSAYCKVYWGKTKDDRGSCSFSVYIPTFPGEAWQARKVKALAEARQVAEAFVQHVHPRASDGEMDTYPVAVR
jgi:hypothetical protein